MHNSGIDFLKRYRWVVTVILLVLLPVVYFSSRIDRERELHWYDRVFLSVTMPTQRFLSYVSSGIQGVFNNYLYLVDTKQENELLKRENDSIQQRLRQLLDVELENERLRILLSFKEREKLPLISAQVIAQDVSPDYLSLRINKGVESGIERRMPVLTPEGVVGQIFRVAEGFSDVLLLTDTSSTIDSLIQRSRFRGTVEGASQNLCRLKYLGRTDDVMIGDVILTSGMGGVFPKGLVVGEVTEISERRFGISKDVWLKPACDLFRLEEVFVVKRTPLWNETEAPSP